MTLQPSQQAFADKIVATARELVRETGDFDLPMRQLAARAHVSLRTLYQIFGSKTGVINAMLVIDQKLFRTLSSRLNSADEIENIFDRSRLGIGFYAENQPFYRALFRAAQGYDGNVSDPASENIRAFQSLCRRASRARLITPDVNPDIVGEMISDIFASNVRRWARGNFDISLVDLKLGFGFSVVLASVTERKISERLQLRIIEFQRKIEVFGVSNTMDEKRA